MALYPTPGLSTSTTSDRTVHLVGISTRATGGRRLCLISTSPAANGDGKAGVRSLNVRTKTNNQSSDSKEHMAVLSGVCTLSPEALAGRVAKVAAEEVGSERSHMGCSER